MEASIREGYENGDYFTGKMMETDISNEIAFSSGGEVKDCSETIHSSDVQVTGYQVETSEDSVVFVESADIVHNLPESHQVQVQGSSEEELGAKVEESSSENNPPVSESTEILQEHATQATENLSNDYVVEHARVDSIEIPDDQMECQENSAIIDEEPTQSDSNIEEVIPSESSNEQVDNSVVLNSGVEELPCESETVTDIQGASSCSEEVVHDVTEVNGQETDITQEKISEVVEAVPTVEDPIDDGEPVKEESSNQFVENISDANSVVEISEVNESADMSSLHLSEASGNNLVIEEDEEPMQIVEEPSNDKSEQNDVQLITNDKEEHDQVVESDANVIQTPAEVYYEQSFDETITLEDACVVKASSIVSVLDVTDGPNTNVIEVEYESTTDKAEVVENVSAKSEKPKYPEETEPTKKRKTRTPIFDVPMHVIGTNVAKPLENVPNGKAVPKPRLGVKVPYRNLTSQIVSKDEIEQEVFERSRQKEAASKGQANFARSLTHRLARKLAGSCEDNDVQVKREIKEQVTDASSSLSTQDANTPIKDNSDLLAILEGDGDDIPFAQEFRQTENVASSNMKLLEKEIALQQLQELPNQAPTPRTYRSRYAKTTKPTVPVKDEAKPAVQHEPPPVDTNEKIPKDPLALDSDSPPPTLSKKDLNIIELSPRKQPIEIEPQVKVNMVLKTYSRKRNISEVPGSPIETPPKKPVLIEDIKPIVTETPTNVYMTKSSRVIKKKVIWDPDETPSRVPKPSLKSPDSGVKVSKPVIKNVSAEKVEKVTKPVEKKLTEKVEKLVKSPEKKTTTEKASAEKKTTEKASLEKKTTEKASLEKKTTEKASPEKATKKKISPKMTKTPAKKPLTEVERLLMDEGAVKMLYDLKNTEDNVPKKKKDFFSVDRAHKEIMKKANQLKNELEQNTSTESPKSLRKKEGPSPSKPAVTQERKMSKDSIRSSVHTPPGSPFPHSQASMLIRRRSSSSISSSDELDSDAARPLRRRSDVPRPKRFKKTSEDSKSDLVVKGDSVEKLTAANPYKSLTVKKNNKHVAIEINDVNKNFFTFEILDELITSLDKFSKDKEVNVVSITSSNSIFCSGLDYSYLLANKEDLRKEKAKRMAKKVKEFLLCLLHFPKVLVAGIQGECVGLGVTMLPLFDLVIASDAAIFRTPFANLGCLGEGSCLLNVPFVTAHGLATELLYTGQQLTADDAFRRGLVSKLCWPEKYKDTVKSVVASISKGSKQSLLASKTQLRSGMIKQVEAALNSETNILIEHWTSAECQKNFGDLSKN